jgi:hypothetical protein
MGEVFLGTVDDVVLRHPWGWGFLVTDDFLDRMLAEIAIVGEPTLINDGYLLNSEPLRRSLLISNSPLRQLIRTGQVRILSRQQGGFDLVDMAEEMAAQGIDTFWQLTRKPFWKEQKEDLRRFSRDADDNGFVTKWPPYDTGFVFEELVRNSCEQKISNLGISEKFEGSFLEVAELFFQQMQDDKKRPRDKWEKIVIDKYNAANEFDRHAEQELMRFANQIYHMGFSLSLAAQKDTPVFIESRLSPAFFDWIVKPEIRESEVPTFKLDSYIPYRDGFLIRAILEDATLQDHKSNYLARKQQFFNQQCSASALKHEAEQYAALFNKFIKKYAEENPESFYKKQSKGINLSIELGTAAFDLLTGSATSLLYLLLSRWKGYERVVIPKIISIFRGPMLELKQPPDSSGLRAASGFVPMNLQLNNEKALEFCNGLPSEAVFPK